MIDRGLLEKQTELETEAQAEEGDMVAVHGHMSSNTSNKSGGAIDIQEEVALQKAIIKQQQQLQVQMQSKEASAANNNNNNNNNNDNASKDGPSPNSNTTAATTASTTKLSVVKTIGVGTFGKISVVRIVRGSEGTDTDTDTGVEKSSTDDISQKAFALKQVAKSNLFESKRGLESAMTERYILSELGHPFLMNALDTWQDQSSIYFLMNFASGGDLFSKLQKGEVLSESRICLYMAEISLALDFLHCQNIIYRDMKAENVLIGKDGHIKLTDFGLSKYCENAAEQGFLRAYTICGTPEYMAPELIDSDGYGYGQKADWWALGILMHEMMYGFPPFYSEDPQEALNMVLTAEIEFPEYPEFTPQCKHVVSELLIKDEMSRLGNRHIFQHVFFNKFNLEDVYDKLVDPEYIPQLQNAFDCSNFDELHEDYVEKSMDSVIQVPGFHWRPTTAIQKQAQTQTQTR